MAADGGISLVCFLEVEVILEVKNGPTININWNQKWWMRKMTVILSFANHCFPTIPNQ